MTQLRTAACGLAARGIALFALNALFGYAASGEAAILAYLSEDGLGESATPVAPQEMVSLAAGSGTFHIWVQSDELLAGVSLDLAVTGDAIRFADATTHNPASGGDLRWLPDLIRHGTVSDTTITRIEGGALVGLTDSGQGIGPATAAADAMHEHAGGFLFATVTYVVENVSESATVNLSIGHNLIADDEGLATDSIFLGPGDGPVANVSAASGSIADLSFAPLMLADADFNSDGVVAGGDFLLWQRGHGLTSNATRSDGDATSDGIVDSSDLSRWETEFGTIAARSVAQPVPEPSGLALLLFAIGPRRARRARREGSWWALDVGQTWR